MALYTYVFECMVTRCGHHFFWATLLPLFLIPYQAYLYITVLPFLLTGIYLVDFQYFTGCCIIAQVCNLEPCLHSLTYSLGLTANHDARRRGVVNKKPTAFTVSKRLSYFQNYVCGVSAALEGKHGTDQTQLGA